jgi:hypothetical protein
MPKHTTRWILRGAAICLWAGGLGYLAFNTLSAIGLIFSALLVAFGVAVWLWQVAAILSLGIVFATLAFGILGALDSLRAFKTGPQEHVARRLAVLLSAGGGALAVGVTLWFAGWDAHKQRCEGRPFAVQSPVFNKWAAIVAVAGWAILAAWFSFNYWRIARSVQARWSRILATSSEPTNHAVEPDGRPRTAACSLTARR